MEQTFCCIEWATYEYLGLDSTLCAIAKTTQSHSAQLGLKNKNLKYQPALWTSSFQILSLVLSFDLVGRHQTSKNEKLLAQQGIPTYRYYLFQTTGKHFLEH